MSMALKLVPYQYQTPVTGATGAGAGLAVSEFLSEYTTRLLGWTSYLKATAKSAVKLAIGTIALSASAKPRTTTNQKLFTQAFAYASMGSILLDWIAVRVSGGVTGLANKAQMATRVMLMGTQTVSPTLAQYETPQVSAPAPAVSPSTQLGRY